MSQQNRSWIEDLIQPFTKDWNDITQRKSITEKIVGDFIPREYRKLPIETYNKLLNKGRNLEQTLIDIQNEVPEFNPHNFILSFVVGYSCYVKTFPSNFVENVLNIKTVSIDEQRVQSSGSEKYPLFPFTRSRDWYNASLFHYGSVLLTDTNYAEALEYFIDNPLFFRNQIKYFITHVDDQTFSNLYHQMANTIEILANRIPENDRKSLFKDTLTPYTEGQYTEIKHDILSIAQITQNASRFQRDINRNRNAVQSNTRRERSLSRNRGINN